MRRRNWTKALVCFDLARQSFARLGNKYKLATSLNNLGVIYFHLNQPDAAQQTLVEALELYQHLQDARGEALARNNLTKMQMNRE
ncbi:MAG: tetratricopeptide repeat protein [Chloroflexi bacterium]|nr:tetratricopeptide repeat protein [Chloroflexota bacterium]